MAGAKNLSGVRFGKLVAVKPTEKRSQQGVIWECRCDCGMITYAYSASLISGKKKSCGCLRREVAGMRSTDLTGMRFGKLTVIRSRDARSSGSVVWECRCDCGNSSFHPAIALRSGGVKSCGCIRKDISEKQIHNIAGMQFGRLTAQTPTDKRDKCRSVIWKCKCDCGETVFVPRSSLVDGSSNSCGCFHKEVTRDIYTNVLKPQFQMGTKLDLLREDETKLRSDNKTGIKGVHMSEGYYKATLKFRGILIQKRCKTIEEAAEARRRMRIVHEEFLEWWDSLTEEEKQTASEQYESEKEMQTALFRKRIADLL